MSLLSYGIRSNLLLRVNRATPLRNAILSRSILCPSLSIGRPLSTTAMVMRKTPNLNNLQQVPHRYLHSSQLRPFKWTAPRRLVNGFNENSGKPIIRTIRISPVMLFLSCAFTFTLFFMIIPIIFKFMFPFILGAVIVYQFRHWKTDKIYTQLMKFLPTSNMTVNYKTLNSLQYKFISQKASDADQFINFVESRIMESISANERGINKVIDTRSINFNSNTIKLDTNRMKSFGKNIDGDLIISIQYPLVLNDSKTQRTQLIADAMITILDDSLRKTHEFKLFSDLAKTNKNCRMVISLLNNNAFIPKQFIISTPGLAGEFYSKFDFTTRNGHTEYTIKNNQDS